MSIVYTGIDFHKRTSTIYFLNPDGKDEVKTISSDHLVSELANRKNLRVGIEASTGVNHIVDQLKAMDIDVLIINPNQFRAVGLGGKKTDQRDAKALAQFLKLDYIPTVHHKSLGSRRLKSLLRIREQYVHSRVNATNHIRGILREYGIKMPAGTEEFWSQAPEKIKEIDYPPIQDHLLDLLYEARRMKTKEKNIEKMITELLKGESKTKNLMSIPGIGILTAAAIIAVADDFKRFNNAKAFASYLGLVPRESSSGDKRMMGRITKSGPEIVRRYLIHGARTTMKYTNDNSKEPIKIWANKLKKKVGMNKATVALAHRMARIAYRIAIEDRLYVK